MSIRTYSSVEAADKIGCSERWLLDQLRANRFRGRKVCRRWRLTDEDIQFALDVCANNVMPMMVVESETAFSSLTPTSRRKLVG